MTTDTLVLSVACIRQPAMAQRPARTLLIGAATLSVRGSFGTYGFDLAADSSTVTDDPAQTIAWLADRLRHPPGRLLLWRAEDIVVPALIECAGTARDAVAAARMLRGLHAALEAGMVDVADAFGGLAATSFDAIAHHAGLPFVPMTANTLADAHRTGNHGDIEDHLAARAKATWRLWLDSQPDIGAVRAATEDWLATPSAEVRP
jgi:hypothetical protein